MGYEWYNENSQKFMDREYLLPGQTLQQRVWDIANNAERILKSEAKDPAYFDGFAAKFENYMSRGFYSLATPVWTNFGDDRGLPISCFGSHIDDSMAEIFDALSEVGMMSKNGGGTAGYFGALRGRGAPIRNGKNGTSSGSVHFMQLFDTVISVVSQGSTRRGNFAAYLDIDHSDIMEFLDIRSEEHPLQDLNFAVVVTDAWMQGMIDGDTDKRKVWAKVLRTRANTGYPYIMFKDTVNRMAPDVYRDKGLVINHSQLCSEIVLPTNSEESFVCCLSSVNLELFDEWVDTDAVRTLVFLLDAVMSEFITKAETIPHMHRAHRFAKRHRALGLGVLGWHSYLQANHIAFESFDAKMHNASMFRTIQACAMAASTELAEQLGEPELLQGYGRRNATLIAIAPTKSSSFILAQTSEGIEPIKANFYIKDTAKGKFVIKNKHLVDFLNHAGHNDEETWKSILANGGSVQHLSWMAPEDKAVFKTFAEISPLEIVQQAAQRQKWIDQAQSTNLMIHHSIPTKDVNALMIEAWKLGVKTLYYQLSTNAAQEFAREIMACSSCES